VGVTGIEPALPKKLDPKSSDRVFSGVQLATN